MENFFIQFIPIIIIVLFFVYTKSAITFSNTILGRFIAVLLIAYYTLVDAVLGLFICVIIIFYYQSDYVEGMLNLSEGYSEKMKIVIQKQDIDEINGIVEEEDDEIIIIDNIPNVDAEKEFQDLYCVKNGLMYENRLIKQEMVHHMFPEIVYDDIDNRCNPCEKNCKHKIIKKKDKVDDDDDEDNLPIYLKNLTDEKIKTEIELIPKKSNDFMENMMGKLISNFYPNTNNDTFSETFSLFTPLKK